MTTTTATPTTTTSNTSTAQAASAVGSQEFAGNFNTFLTLLTTQLQNQDPLSPMDTSQFTSQLVEFASVEQQINMNTNLQSLMSMQQTSDSLQALQLVGANVTINSNTAALSQATNSPATWSFSSPSPATGTVTITSSTGQVAFTGTTSLSAGSQNYIWNGQGNNGVTWPDGNYTLSITATGANGQPVTVTTQVQGTISSVNISQNPPMITVGGQNYPISAIQSINSGGGGTGLARLLH
jgi:flagellar basal-body rod modification protein FlgD